jgi:hypothetical protein
MKLSVPERLRLLAAALSSAILSALITLQITSAPPAFQPLQVVLHNHSGQMISSVHIEHGNLNTQEKIQAFQIGPGEYRELVLNHEPGLGFNIDVNYADGKTVSACIGKFSESYRLEVIMDETGLHSEKEP